MRGEAFADRIDGVRAHGVARVNQHMQHDRPATVRHPKLEILDTFRATAALLQFRLQAVCQDEYFVLCGVQLLNHGIRVLDLDDLDLSNRHRVRRHDLKAAAFPGQLRRATHGGDDRRFLDDHRYDVVLVVDEEIRRNGERQAEYADDVFDHLVGGLHRQQAFIAQQELLVGRRDQSVVRQRLDAVGMTQSVKIGNSRITQRLYSANPRP